MCKKSRALLNLIFVVFIPVILLSSPAAGANTITVPDDYLTIQQAVNFASPGDTVYVRAGTYYENVTIDKSLTLQGEDRNTTIIDGSEIGNVIYVTASNVTISGFKVINGECGIKTIEDWLINHVTIRDLIITSNGNVGTTDFRGGIVIKNGHTTGAFHIIEDCIISDNYVGIIAYRFPKSIIRNCEFFGNENYVMDIRYTSGVLIADNEFHHNQSVMYLNGLTNTIIEKNYIYSNPGTAMQFSLGANFNIIRDNIIYDNGAGINMKAKWMERGNKIYHNDLIKNTLQAFDGGKYPGLNIWDNGYPDGGNYWSDYSGVDLDFDGIGDTPYVFEGNQDRYPLMHPLRFILAEIDIKPGSYPNSINLGSKGNVPVAIFSTTDFDATTVDPRSVTLGGASVKLKGKDTPMASFEDVNGDGLDDIIVHVETTGFELSLGDTVAVLEGFTFDGTPIRGEDTIRIVHE